MKKVILGIALVFISSSAFGDGGTCVKSVYDPDLGRNGDHSGISKMTLLCTHSTTDPLIATVAQATMNLMSGKYFYYVKSKVGSTPVTDNSELTIQDDDNMTLVDPAVNGLNFLDSTTGNRTFPYNAFRSLNDYPVIDADDIWTVKTTGNSVSAADFYLDIYMLNEKK